jgi:uncharacterized delta-60 repeat protein
MYRITLNRASFLIFSILVIAFSQAVAQAGHLDSSFGTGGVFTTNFNQTNVTVANGAALQSDGKIVVVGSTPGGDALVRLNTNGTLDSSFGSGGIVNTDFGSLGPVVAVAIQPDGKIVAAATGFLGGSVGRFNSDGRIDTTFGNGGFAVSKSIDAGVGEPMALALQTDGKILVTGFAVIARYTSTGQLDPSFGSTGLGGSGIAAMPNRFATGMALQPDGKILVTSGVGAPTLLESQLFLPSEQAGSIARYNANGSLDTSFGIAGQSSSVASAGAIALQSDGKIVVAGTLTTRLSTERMSDGIIIANNQTGFGLVRYNTNGSVDSSFGSGGGVVTGFGNVPAGAAFALAIQSNGDIVVAGQAGAGNQYFGSSSFALARYTPTGQMDTSFGSNGTVLTIIRPGLIAFVSKLLVQSDGKIVATGNTGMPEGQYFLDNFAVARYLSQ